MAEQRPPPLDYQSPESRRPLVRTTINSKFFIALTLGTGASAIFFWLGGWRLSTEIGTAIFLLSCPALKIIAAIPLLFFQNWRSFAAGLFASLALGDAMFSGLIVR